MSAIKLTERQIQVLISINTGGVRQVKHGHGAWRIVGTDSPTVVGRVINLKLAEWVRRTNGDECYDAFLTPHGRHHLDLARAEL